MHSPIQKMGKMAGTAFMATAVMLLGACASSQSTPTASASSDTETSKVAQYQQAVHNQARAKNVHVHWVHPPDEDDLEKNDG